MIVLLFHMTYNLQVLYISLCKSGFLGIEFGLVLPLLTANCIPSWVRSARGVVKHCRYACDKVLLRGSLFCPAIAEGEPSTLHQEGTFFSYSINRQQGEVHLRGCVGRQGRGEEEISLFIKFSAS